jgi:hypothetical protein
VIKLADHWKQRHWQTHKLQLLCANEMGPCFKSFAIINPKVAHPRDRYEAANHISGATFSDGAAVRD